MFTLAQFTWTEMTKPWVQGIMKSRKKARS